MASQPLFSALHHFIIKMGGIPGCAESEVPHLGKSRFEMTVEGLIGCRVWIKVDQFRSVPGTISAVLKADPQGSIAASIFEVSLLRGKVIKLSGSDILKFDRAAEPQIDRVAA